MSAIFTEMNGMSESQAQFHGEFHRDGVLSQRLTGRWVDLFEFVSSRSWGSK